MFETYTNFWIISCRDSVSYDWEVVSVVFEEEEAEVKCLKLLEEEECSLVKVEHWSRKNNESAASFESYDIYVE